MRSHLGDPLYRNGYALVLNTGVTSLLGVVATVVMTRSYSGADVGRGAALVAAMQLLSAVTQLNLSSVLMRFLPKAGANTSGFILRSYGLAVCCALVVSSLVLGFVHLFGHHDYVLHMSLGMSAFFVLATAAYSIFNLQDAALTGLRQTIWVPVENAVFGIGKIVALLAFSASLGATGILVSWVVPLALILLPVNVVIFKSFVRRVTYDGKSSIDRKRIAKFIAGDYPSNLLSQSNTTLLPLIVIAVLDETNTAYFIGAQTVAIALDLVVLNLSQSLTVEGANDESRIRELTRKMLWHMTKITVPMVAFIIIAAPYLMGVLKPEYRDNSTTLLQLLALATLPKIFASVFGSLARLQHKTHKIAFISLVNAFILIVGSVVLMPRIGIEGVGIAAIASQLITVTYMGPKVIAFIRRGSF